MPSFFSSSRLSHFLPCLAGCSYYEPLASVKPSIEVLVNGPPVRKLLFMTDPAQVEGLLKPHWGKKLQGSGAAVMQAVPDMLEVVPDGVNKWGGLQVGGWGVGYGEWVPQHIMVGKTEGGRMGKTGLSWLVVCLGCPKCFDVAGRQAGSPMTNLEDMDFSFVSCESRSVSERTLTSNTFNAMHAYK